MDADFWHQRWDRQQIAFHQQQVNPLLQRYWPALQLEQGSRVFVPLCGKSVDMLWLLEQGYSLVGSELSELAVEAFFTENQLQPQRSQIEGSGTSPLQQWQVDSLTLLCGDLFAIDKDRCGQFDVIYDRAALIALPESMRQGYVDKLVGLLKPGGQILLITLEYPSELHQGPPFSVLETDFMPLFDGFSVENLGSELLTRDSQGFSRRGLLGSTEVVYRLQHRGK
ncbi:MAG: thiopurine S-methyltransferase [Motiliproteus sp.]